jgi:protein-tyrosine phosphatase
MTPSHSTNRTAARKPSSNPAEVSPGIFVGGFKDAAGFVGARFCVLDERPEELDELPGTTHVPVYDEASDSPRRENLDRLASLVKAAHDRKEPVLLFCGHGVRRSPLAAAWYLHRTESLSLDEAYERLAAARPGVQHVREWTSGWRILDEPDGRGLRPTRSRR